MKKTNLIIWIVVAVIIVAGVLFFVSPKSLFSDPELGPRFGNPYFAQLGSGCLELQSFCNPGQSICNGLGFSGNEGPVACSYSCGNDFQWGAGTVCVSGCSGNQCA